MLHATVVINRYMAIGKRQKADVCAIKCVKVSSKIRKSGFSKKFVYIIGMCETRIYVRSGLTV